MKRRCRGRLLFFIGALAGAGCSESTTVGGADTDSGTDTGTEAALDSADASDAAGDSDVDTVSDSAEDSDTRPEDAADWPLDDCVYHFHVVKSAPGTDGEEPVFEPVDDVEPYDVAFSEGLGYVYLDGYSPWDSSEKITSLDNPCQSDDDGELLTCELSDFALGGLFSAWREDPGYAAASLDFYGSGLPVILRYRGYLEIWDCGPPVWTRN